MQVLIAPYFCAEIIVLILKLLTRQASTWRSLFPAIYTRSLRSSTRPVSGNCAAAGLHGVSDPLSRLSHIQISLGNRGVRLSMVHQSVLSHRSPMIERVQSRNTLLFPATIASNSTPIRSDSAMFPEIPRNHCDIRHQNSENRTFSTI